MDRKTIKIDRRTLEELARAANEYLEEKGYSNNSTLGAFSTTLVEMTRQHPNFAAEVTVPDEEPVVKKHHGFDLEPLPSKDDGDHMTIREFIRAVQSGLLTDDDGVGDYATKDGVSCIAVYPSDIANLDPRWTHVVWYNK